MEDFCVSCDKFVRPRQQAVACDICAKWQHRTCNSGISLTQYRAAVRDGITLPFNCSKCQNAFPEPMDVTEAEQDVDMTVNYSEIQDTSSRLSLRVPTTDEPLTSTRLSAADTIIAETTTVRTDETIDHNDSDFDVTRQNREMPDEVQETSVADETVDDIPIQEPVSYEVVVGGSERGHGKLVSSDGYAFVKKRTLANGTIDWRCSVRNKGSGCPAMVKQFRDAFRVAGGVHNHQSKPGLVTAVKVKTELKTVAKTRIFEAAGVLVKSVTDELQRPDQPEGSRPSHDALLKMCNRSRKELRPTDPASLEFEVFLCICEYNSTQFCIKTK